MSLTWLFSSLHQVVHARLGTQFFFEPEDVRPGDHLSYQAVGIVRIPKHGGPPDAGRHAGRELADTDAVQAEMAFADVADWGQVLLGTWARFAILEVGDSLVIVAGILAHQCGGNRCRLCIGVPKVEGARAIRAGSDTGPTADALVIVHNHHTVFILIRCGYRAYWYTGWVVALHTGARREASRHVGVSADFLFQNGTVNHPRWQLILGHAGNGAGMAAHTLAQVDHHHPMAF